MALKRFFLVLVVGLVGGPFTSAAQREKRDIGCWMGFDGNLNWFADSLNFLTEPRYLPKFLAYPLFDWKMKDAIWECQSDKSDGFSARLAILRRVINEEALEWIVKSRNEEYDKLYNPEVEEKRHVSTFDNSYPVLPFMEFSIRQLAEKRLKEIARIKQKMKH
jgi:hypothetical protein